MRVSRVVVVVALASGCSHDGALDAAALRYSPHTRAVTITTVPLLVKEMSASLPFLPADFSPHGVLAGKEVYAFSPSTVTVVAGDTVHFTFINPEDDDHAFVLRDLYVAIPAQSRHDTTYVAREPGVYDFTCSVPSHLPMMRGQLVVLAPSTVLAGPPPLGRP